MQGRECSEGMSKSEMGLWSLGQGSQIRVWNGEGRVGSSMWSSENRTKVCGWMGYVVGDLRTSLGHGDVWIRVPVRCYTECNRYHQWMEEENTHLSNLTLSLLIRGSCIRRWHTLEQNGLAEIMNQTIIKWDACSMMQISQQVSGVKQPSQLHT